MSEKTLSSDFLGFILHDAFCCYSTSRCKAGGWAQGKWVSSPSCRPKLWAYMVSLLRESQAKFTAHPCHFCVFCPPFLQESPHDGAQPWHTLNILQDTTIVNHPMFLPGHFSVSHRLPGLCSLDLWDCRQLLFFLLLLMPHLCSTAQDEKRPVPCSVGRNGCQWAREAIAVEAGSTVYPRQRIRLCREHEDSCTIPHQLRWALELLEPWFVFKNITRRMESVCKGARNRPIDCVYTWCRVDTPQAVGWWVTVKELCSPDYQHAPGALWALRQTAGA